MCDHQHVVFVGLFIRATAVLNNALPDIQSRFLLLQTTYILKCILCFYFANDDPIEQVDVFLNNETSRLMSLWVPQHIERATTLWKLHTNSLTQNIWEKHININIYIYTPFDNHPLTTPKPPTMPFFDMLCTHDVDVFLWRLFHVLNREKSPQDFFIWSGKFFVYQQTWGGEVVGWVTMATRGDQSRQK